MREHAMDTSNAAAGARHFHRPEPLKCQPAPSANDDAMADCLPSPSPEKTTRSSFSSVRETACDLTQTFVSRACSHLEHAVDDADVDLAMADGEPAPHAVYDVLDGAMDDDTQPGRLSPLERLPAEIFGLIVGHLVLDIPPNGIDRRNIDLVALRLTSREISAKTLSTVYQHVTVPHSRIFHKFLAQLRERPSRGELVRRLDFSHFNPWTLFSTQAERAATRHLTSETLLQCLELTPGLQEFLAQEHVKDDLGADVLEKLFLGLDRLQALDLCGCASPSFRDAFSTLPAWNWPDAIGIRRLSMHKCRMLPPAVFETILPRLKQLTHLDVAGTAITDAALEAIPRESAITHLNLASCKQLSADGIVDFLSGHAAALESLVFLSLATDIKTHDQLQPAHVTRILEVLPPTLRSLNLKGSKMESSHVGQLLPLSKHLEELGLGRGLTLADVDRLFAPDAALSIEDQLAWVPSAVRYLDMTDMSSGDLPGLYTDFLLLTKASAPLEVIEFSEDVLRTVKKSPASLARAGWRISEIHRRSWLVRVADAACAPRDDGRRPWKMGAQSWGMRKIPVADADVGGLYGSFMFGRDV